MDGSVGIAQVTAVPRGDHGGLASPNGVFGVVQGGGAADQEDGRIAPSPVHAGIL